MVWDLDINDHAEVRRRVIEPVLNAMYREGEVRHAGVTVEGDRVVVSITSIEDVVEYDIGSTGDGPLDARILAYELADYIATNVSENTFARGEQRQMHGPIPGPRERR